MTTPSLPELPAPFNELWPLIRAYGDCRADNERHHGLSVSAEQYLRLAESNLRDALSALAADRAATAPDSAIEVLRDLDARLRACFGLPVTAEEAYDSSYQEIVAASLTAPDRAANSLAAPEAVMWQWAVVGEDGQVDKWLESSQEWHDKVVNGQSDSKWPHVRARALCVAPSVPPCRGGEGSRTRFC